MNRSGAVLVIVLLSVLALELVAMSALGFARLAQLGALHARSRASLQGAAEDALAYAAATLRSNEVSAHAPGSAWTIDVPAPDTAAVAVRARRLASGLVLLEASATAQGGVASSAAIVRVLEPDSILAGFPAVVSTTLPGSITGAPPAAVTCPEGRAPATLPVHTVLAGDDTLPFGRAARIRWEHAPDLAAAEAAAPDSAVFAVGERFVFASGDTTLTSEFAGVLVVSGDLRVLAGGTVRGLTAVNGILILEPGAVLHGSVRALAVEDHGGIVMWDRCAVESALGVPALQRTYRTSTRWRLPAF